MKTYGGVEVKLHTFLTLALDQCFLSFLFWRHFSWANSLLRLPTTPFVQKKVCSRRLSSYDGGGGIRNLTKAVNIAFANPLGVSTHILRISALERCEWSVWGYSRFTNGNHCIGGSVRPRAPLKRRSVSTRLHGATSQKTIFILVAVRTWNLTSASPLTAWAMPA
jgi:hypothetical protein